MFNNVLVAVDGSAHAKRAVEHGANIARKYEAQLTLLHVMTRLGSDHVPEDLREFGLVEHIEVTEADTLRRVAEATVEEATDYAKSHGAKNIETVIDHGDPANRIVDFCNAHDVDLIVMGRRGLGDMVGLLMGSVSHKIANLSPCTCMTVPKNRDA